MEKINRYGEILFLGPCNYSCYYCLQNEMTKLKEEKENQLNVFYEKWNNFNKFLDTCKREKIDKIYLSSTCTDPLLYKYLDELINKIKSENFKIGIRTNGLLATEKMNAINELDEEISFSVNSFNEDTNYKITKNNRVLDYDSIFKGLEKSDKKCRVSIVVNKYNYMEIPEMVKKLSEYKCISYVQLRKIYKYYEDNKRNEEEEDFEYVKNWLNENANIAESYFESKVYNYKNLKVSLWENVFSKNSVQSINYYTNGIISEHNLLIPIYEESENGK